MADARCGDHDRDDPPVVPLPLQKRRARIARDDGTVEAQKTGCRGHRLAGVAAGWLVGGIAAKGDLVFSTPGILRLLEALIFPGVPAADIYLHPIARAAWVGIFATALNLLPIGQLDGGHILYSFIGERHRLLSKIFVAALVPMGYFSISWVFWAVLLFFFGLKHPRIYDSAEMGSGRKKLGWLALVMFLLCFSLSPISTPG